MDSFIIAEIAQAHEGSIGILHSYIDAIAGTGVDAIKFQTHIAEAESSHAEPFRIPFSYEDATRYDYWKRMSFSLDQWREIKKHCEDAGLEFMSSAFSQTALDWLIELGMERFKIASGEVTNLLMLEKIACTGKPIILSSGMSSFRELDRAVDFIRPFGNALSILQCTTRYPTPANAVGLNVIPELRERYPDVRVGLSDHSGKWFTSVAAAGLGASVFEFHAVFDRRAFGPDSSSSLTIDEISQLVGAVRFIDEARKNPVDKSDNTSFEAQKQIFEKSLAARHALPEGHILSFDDLETKKPAGQGISASDFKTILGKPLRRSLDQYEFILPEDV